MFLSYPLRFHLFSNYAIFCCFVFINKHVWLRNKKLHFHCGWMTTDPPVLPCHPGGRPFASQSAWLHILHFRFLEQANSSTFIWLTTTTNRFEIFSTTPTTSTGCWFEMQFSNQNEKNLKILMKIEIFSKWFAKNKSKIEIFTHVTGGTHSVLVISHVSEINEIFI